jgi:hypothetical protein
MIMTLKRTLANLVDYSRRSGQPSKMRLGHGLTVGVSVDGDMVRVQLARADVFPAMSEWATIINHWPGQCVVLTAPKQIKDVGTYYLIGKVQMTPELVPDVPAH